MGDEEMKQFIREFNDREKFEEFLNNANQIEPSPNVADYIILHMGVRRIILEKMANGEFVMEDVYYAIGWKGDESKI